ncbi:MAG: hypothetical protein L3J23_07180 [Flavobacteriaceae bacterium]|nr:hypothetical protein [Flavobacteriaceae bacterium]
MKQEIVQALLYTLPSIASGFVAYYFFKEYGKSNTSLQKLKLVKESKNLTTTLRLQAYERMTLFLERISLANIVLRIKAKNDNKQAYELSLIHTIETEFEHNLAQQIYISDACWNVISTAKNTTVQIIRDCANDAAILNADELRKNIIQKVINKQGPSDTALAFIKNEVNEYF